MSEDDYILVSNKCHITHAINILRDVLPGKTFGVDDSKLAQARSALIVLSDDVFQNLHGKVKEGE